MEQKKTQIFEQNRQTLEGLAYRMLGSLAEAQDVVQDTYLEWKNVKLDTIQNPRAWLIKVCSRLSLNALRLVRVKRTSYFGLWLPEPLVQETNLEPYAQMQLDETVSVALLMTLEKLSPMERAVYLLYEVFDYSFDEIAKIVGKTSTNCRQIAKRARQHIHQDKPRFQTTPEEQQKFLEVFFQASRQGKLELFKEILANNAELYADGGGKVNALVDVLIGAESIGKFFINIWKQYKANNINVEFVPQWFNGAPGALILENGALTTAITMDIHAQVIQRIYGIRNPDKLEVLNRKL